MLPLYSGRYLNTSLGYDWRSQSERAQGKNISSDGRSKDNKHPRRAVSVKYFTRRDKKLKIVLNIRKTHLTKVGE